MGNRGGTQILIRAACLWGRWGTPDYKGSAQRRPAGQVVGGIWASIFSSSFYSGNCNLTALAGGDSDGTAPNAVFMAYSRSCRRRSGFLCCQVRQKCAGRLQRDTACDLPGPAHRCREATTDATILGSWETWACSDFV